VAHGREGIRIEVVGKAYIACRSYVMEMLNLVRVLIIGESLSAGPAADRLLEARDERAEITPFSAGQRSFGVARRALPAERDCVLCWWFIRHQFPKPSS
jgi:hypothetical protein